MLDRVMKVSLFALGTLSAAAIHAHHGWSWYTGNEFTLSGIVVETHLGNPHDRLTVESEGRRWSLVLSPPSRSRRAGFGEEQIKIGDTITAYGHRHSDEQTLEMKTERLKVGERSYELYPNR